MLKKSFEILKKNPILILFSLIFELSNISLNSDLVKKYHLFFSYSALIIIIFFVLSLMCTAGFNAMVGEAVISGKTKVSTFLSGIKNFSLRLFLAALLFGLFVFGYSIIILILSFIIDISSSNIPSIGTLIILIIVLLSTLFLAPLFILWVPAMISDDIGVTESLRSGAGVAKESYWILFLSIIVFIIPDFIYGFIVLKNLSFNIQSFNMISQMHTSGFWILKFIDVFWNLIFNIFLYVLYKSKTDSSYSLESIQNSSQDVDDNNIE
ncbi:hypothetical protein CLTEP_24530 [Clostridium tepidiprofundi DSM 19306]|uniref:DUF7847 domain-containing protein n=1 Tax=Clostridium tepidiprofundi DSM 19306 TaxID=1121338 RepID=A0A151ATN6_9CLOT|nr:hypothetical protein [Clostridium tepidiprofundi]KYH30996.1 hypothetical protein CLTEP_24530 [Clostridium tepidiprofundi DSM 19306]